MAEKQGSKNVIKIDHMAKIYGHASLEVRIRRRKVSQCRLHIVESSRFFERMLKGKRFEEARRLTSRICGICSPSHNTTSIMAVENALGIRPSDQVRKLREALILGGYIQSHALHLYFLALPDYMGYGGILDMADKYPGHVDKAFRLKRLGNDIIEAIGGRPCHPVTTNIGHFTNMPEKAQLNALVMALKKGLRDANRTVDLFAGFKKPGFEARKQMGALRDNRTYAILTGRPVIGGTKIRQEDFADSIESEDRSYSTSKFIKYNGKEYMVGPLARLNANHEFLYPAARAALRRSGLELPDYNSFNANVARAVEIVHSIEKCIEVIKSIKPGTIDEPYDFNKLKKKEPVSGCAITEAPRGMLYHEYSIGPDGFITRSRVITPTAQNLVPIESDVRAFLPSLVSRPRKRIITEVEKLIRSYDPCISCATHFLDVKFL